MTKDLEGRIDGFLDTISEGMIVFSAGVSDYFSGEIERSGERAATLARHESSADKLRREIELSMYSFSLIPEHQGDVLRLLETVDDIIDSAKKTLRNFLIERPQIPAMLHPGFRELTTVACNAAESAILAARAFFRDLPAIKNHLHKVYFYEREADELRLRLKTNLFASSDFDLAQKNHLRYFIHQVDKIADQAQAVADRLTISAIKRSL
jgi:predicted phosphate transport protein (TIGR00153 family)